MRLGERQQEVLRIARWWHDAGGKDLLRIEHLHGREGRVDVPWRSGAAGRGMGYCDYAAQERVIARLVELGLLGRLGIQYYITCAGRRAIYHLGDAWKPGSLSKVGGNVVICAPGADPGE